MMHPLEILETDERLLNLLQDRDFACEFYAAACNAAWTHTASGYIESALFCHRSNARWVADLRGKSEGYMDFYCSEPEGTITDRVRAELTRLGWTWSETK